MSNSGEAAEQVLKYAMDGTEKVLAITGVASRNLAMFLAAVLKDQKKSKGKTRITRMLRENRPMKIFEIPKEKQRDFAQKCKQYGVLFVGVKDRKNPDRLEIMTFADDAPKVNRILDRLELAKVECAQITRQEDKEERPLQEQKRNHPVRKEIAVDFDDSVSDGAQNFTESERMGGSLSENFLNNSASFTNKRSVREQLKEIKNERGKNMPVEQLLKQKRKER